MPDEPGVELPYSPRFALGKLVVESDVHDILAMNRQSLAPLLRRHANADWGDVESDLWQRNDRAIVAGHWIKSLYRLDGSSDVIGVRTNAERTETRVRVEWDPPQGLAP